MNKINHAQIVKDYLKLTKMYDVPEALSDGMVVEEHLMDAVIKGTKKACAKAILDIIRYGFQWSTDEMYIYRYEDKGSYKEVNADECDFIKYISETYLN